MSEIRVLFAAGGTGGHIFPALFIAEEISKLDSQAVLEFVGTGRPMEEKILAAKPYRRHVIQIVGVRHRGIKGALQFFTMLPSAFRSTWRLISEFRPTVVFGAGGYSAVLPVMIARLRGISTWIHEAELEPGLANWVLAFFARTISVAFPNAKMPCRRKVRYTGHPLRESLRHLRKGARSMEPRKLFITGGSQGAESLDRCMIELAPFLRELDLEVVHQCRASNEAPVRAAYEKAGVPARVSHFIESIAEVYEWADCAISRSGAGAVMELGAINMPAIFVPLPAKSIQQRGNAEYLVSFGKALLVEEGDSFVERMRSALRELLEPERFAAMINAPFPERRADAAQTIAAEIVQIAKKSG